MQVVWRNRRGSSDSLAQLITRASVCCLDILRRLNNFSPVDGVVLRLHMGVGGGTLSAFYVGGHAGKWEYFVAGEPIEQMSDATEEATHGQLVLSSYAYRVLVHSEEVRCGATVITGATLKSSLFLLTDVSEQPDPAPRVGRALSDQTSAKLLRPLAAQQQQLTSSEPPSLANASSAVPLAAASSLATAPSPVDDRSLGPTSCRDSQLRGQSQLVGETVAAHASANERLGNDVSLGAGPRRGTLAGFSHGILSAFGTPPQSCRFGGISRQSALSRNGSVDPEASAREESSSTARPRTRASILRRGAGPGTLLPEQPFCETFGVADLLSMVRALPTIRKVLHPPTSRPSSSLDRSAPLWSSTPHCAALSLPSLRSVSRRDKLARGSRSIASSSPSS